MNAEFDYLDRQLGARYVLAFYADPGTLASRLRAPWKISEYRGAYRMVQAQPMDTQPNLFVVFNSLMLNLRTDGTPKADPMLRYVGFNIPVANPETSELGLMHFRNYSGDERQSPGHYADSVFAPAVWDEHVVGNGIDSAVTLHVCFEPQTGGRIQLQLRYLRSLPQLVEAKTPETFIWAANDSTILRVYQDYGLTELLWTRKSDLRRVEQLEFRAETPEMTDIFDGTEQLVSVISNPIYTRKVFLPRNA